MTRPISYKTKQREAIIDYIASLEPSHVTAPQIVEHFKNEKLTIGRTTIYRLIDKLTEMGEIRKYTTDGVSGACYQYAGSVENCYAHLHLKCEGCGQLFHLECEKLQEIQQYVLSSYHFDINAQKTVLYGKCGNCAGK